MTIAPFAEVTAREFSILGGAAAALEIDETDGGALHLRTHAGGRTWIVESDYGQLVLDVADEDGTYGEVGWLPISDRIRQFGSYCENPTVPLSIADDQTIVARDRATTVAIDLVPQRRPAPSPLRFHTSASITVPPFDLLGLIMRARTMPSGVSSESSDVPLPPMWMEATDEALGLHVDWSELGAPRATYWVEATNTAGHFTVAIPHACIDRFLRTVPAVDEEFEDVALTITLGHAFDGDDERSAMCLESEDWRLVLWLTHPLEERWGGRIEQLLRDDASIEVLDSNHIEWLVSHRRREVRIVLHHATPDVARVSTTLVNGIDESIDLLRELCQLNAASSGVRYWFADDAVFAVADVRCSDLKSLPAVVRDVATAADTYGQMLAALAA